MSRLIPIIGGAVAGGLIALVIASGSTSTKSVTTTVYEPAHGAAIPTSFAGGAANGRGLSINQIYRNASPGVVDIVVTTQNQNPGFFAPSQPNQGEGAGVVYDAKGDILTDEHVVSGASQVTVTFSDGHKASASVVGTDPSTDVAVIHVNAPSSELHPIQFADSSAAQVGDPVVAIGSPFSLPETTTTGIISQTGRSITAPNNYTIPGAIQTDAAINPGNSGGPLLDANGHVLGLNDQIETNNSNGAGQASSSGVGFAIPSNTVVRIADQLISGHSVTHAYVGVELTQSGGGGAQIATQPDQQGNSPIASGSPAANAGLQPGDLITAVNGKAIGSTDQFIATVDTYSPGQTITLTIKRGGSVHNVQIKLGARPASAQTGG
ncbi:MAG: trypsin-like peptidase domain-containing protein [Solirubrobacterales bacterium]|nr:trypsin-like peptidase domain-containing protein [Solirubrobacterales bacterium]